MRFAIRILIVVALLGSSVPARAQSFAFRDIQQIERSEIQIRESRSPIPFARQPEIFLRSETAPPSLDPSLGQPVSQLALNADAFLRVSVPLGNTQPRDATLIDFTVAGNPIRMLAFEAKTDSDFDASHMTLLAVMPDDYARLTISHAGPEIVGTVFVNDQWYRILPDENDAESQLVYPVAVQESAWQRETQPDLESRAGQLEARHLQMAWVAETQPDNFATYADGRPRSYSGPNLGVLDFWDSLIVDPAGNGVVDEAILKAATESFLNEARGFTWVYDSIEVQLEPKTLDDVNTIAAEGLDIELIQLINGIPISRSLKLSMDPTGGVSGFAGTLMREDMAGPYNGPRILQEEARAIAEAALIAEHGIQSTGEFPEERLFYNVVADDELHLIWRMSVRATCGMYFDVDIDGITGQSDRLGASTGDFDDDSATTDRAEDPTAAIRRSFFGDSFSQCRYSTPR